MTTMTATTEHVGACTNASQELLSVSVAGERQERVVKTIRIEPDVWDKLGVAAANVGMDRSALLRQLARWYVGVPGAQLPPRPGQT